METSLISTHAPNNVSIAQSIVQKALTVDLNDFSSESVSKAKLCLLDYLSCVFESRNQQWSEQARDLATPLNDGSVILGDYGRFNLQDAMFANSVMGHGLVREDMHVGSVTHLGVIVWPTVLGVGALHKVTGKQALAAAIVGYELGAKIGRVVINRDNSKYFRPTGLIGPMVAAIVASRLMGLSASTSLSALALAANSSSGLNEWGNTGGSEMYFHPGFAVRNALQCVELAKKGALASATILEGNSGFIKAYSGKNFAGSIELFNEPNNEEILQVFNKPAPACNFAQTPSQAALNVIKKLNITSLDIKSVMVSVTDAAANYPGCASKGPFDNELQAKMSIIFSVAATLVAQDLSQKNYDDLNDPETQRLINITNLEIDDEFTNAYPTRQGARVTITLNDDSKHNFMLADVVPADQTLIKKRFVHSSEQLFDGNKPLEITNFISGLLDKNDIGELVELCSLNQNEYNLLAKGVEK